MVTVFCTFSQEKTPYFGDPFASERTRYDARPIPHEKLHPLFMNVFAVNSTDVGCCPTPIVTSLDLYPACTMGLSVSKGMSVYG